MNSSPLDSLIAAVAPVNERTAGEARARHAALAKPVGALGRLEDLGVALAAIAGRCPPPVPGRPALVICAADHGVHAEGVTPWPQAVTAAMVGAFCRDGAAANALAGVVGVEVHVLDVGVAADLPDHPRLHRRRVRPGTRDLMVEDAMTRDETAAAILAGAAVAGDLLAAGADLLVTGDMGIANTTASAALIAAFAGRPAAAVTGRGTGIDDAMLAHKTAVIGAALDRHGPRDPTDPLATLAALGGLEHAALVGIMLAGAAARVPVLLDGVIAGAAALAASALCPDVTGYLVAGHRSAEPGATIALTHLGLAPLIDLELRLGEGTGALLAVPVVRAAAAALDTMLTLEDLMGGQAP
jgi:nicotinate-nucleotide--dimethylbenzimidazole phosphoribosyltransferase